MVSQPTSQDDAVDDVDEQAEDFDSAEPLSYFGTDFDVHGLVRRLKAGDIVIPSFDPEPVGSGLPGFQRRFVWEPYQMDRFVESLLLGYPVPGIFLVQQSDKKMLVLDGQQRLRTMQMFYDGLRENEVFQLVHASEALRGLTYAKLDTERRRILDNTFIHATIIKYSQSRGGDDAVYQLFERLNTGGTNLYPHEIRVALYNGPFIRLVRELNEDENWRGLFGAKSHRLKDQELILRCLALYSDRENYARPLKKFLNDFAKAHRELQGLDPDCLSRLFRDSCQALETNVGKQAFRTKRAVNAALLDSLVVGLMVRLSRGPLTQASELKSARENLLKNDEFSKSIEKATADEEQVKKRLRIAIAEMDRV